MSAPPDAPAGPSGLPEFDTYLRPRQLPQDVIDARAAALVRNAALNAVIQPRIDVHLGVCDEAVSYLADLQQWVADKSDLDLDADTRQAATWRVAGRCIGLARALISLLRSGFGAEVAPVGRTLHEATRMLSVLGDSEEPGLMRRWLDDEWLRPTEMRAAGARQHARVNKGAAQSLAAARAAGDNEAVAAIKRLSKGPNPQQVSDMSRAIYEVLSRISHNRRSGMSDAYSNDERLMACGPHPDPLIRAEYVHWGFSVVEEAVLHVGNAISALMPHHRSFTTMIRPIVMKLHEARAAHPLDPASLRRLG